MNGNTNNDGLGSYQKLLELLARHGVEPTEYFTPLTVPLKKKKYFLLLCFSTITLTISAYIFFQKVNAFVFSILGLFAIAFIIYAVSKLLNNNSGLSTDSDGIRCTIYKGKKKVLIYWSDIYEIELIEKNKFIWLVPTRNYYLRNQLHKGITDTKKSGDSKILIDLTDLRCISFDIKRELNIRLTSYQLVH